MRAYRSPIVPGWVMPGAIADFDFRNKRAFGAPVSWGMTGTPTPGTSAVMNGSGLNAVYLPGVDGVFRLYPANTVKIVEGVGVVSFGDATFQALWNRDLTNAAWVKTGCTAARSAGCDGVSNSGSRLTATAANATCSQAITLASTTMLLSAVVKRVSGSGPVSLSVDGGATFTALSLTTAFQQLPIPQQTLANPQVVIQITTGGDVIDIDFVDLETNGAGVCPIVPGPCLIVSGTGNLQRFKELPVITNGRGGGGYPNGATGDRWIGTLNSGQAAIYAEFRGNPRSLAGFVSQTDGVAAGIANINPGSPVQTAAGNTSNVLLPAWNKAMSGYAGALTAGGGGSAVARGCLNGGPLVSNNAASLGALNATHMVLGGQGSGVATLDGYIARMALFDHLPPDSLFQTATSFPA